MGTQVPGNTPNTTQTTGTNPTPAPNPTGTEVVETGNGQPATGNTTPPDVGGAAVVRNHNLDETDGQQASQGTGTTPAANDSEVAELQSAMRAPGEHANSHMLVRNGDVDVIRRLWSDTERGVEGAWDRLRVALGRVFG